MSKFGFIALALFLATDISSVFARSRMTGCSGILHRDQSGLSFGGGPGESEGICVFAQSDEALVLKVCHVGRFCRVKGDLHDCKDSGECEQLDHISRIQKQ